MFSTRQASGASLLALLSMPACAPSDLSQERLQLSGGVRQVLNEIRKTKEHNIRIADQAGVLVGADQETNIRMAVKILEHASRTGQMSLGDFKIVWESERASRELLRNSGIGLARNARSTMTLGSHIKHLDALVELAPFDEWTAHCKSGQEALDFSLFFLGRAVEQNKAAR